MTASDLRTLRYMIDRAKRERLARVGKAERRLAEILHDEAVRDVCALPRFSWIPQCGRSIPAHMGLDQYEAHCR